MTIGHNILACTKQVLAAGALLLLAGCDASFLTGQAANTPLPPAPASTGRVIFFRTADYEELTGDADALSQRQATGVTQGDAMFYRDLQPGTYQVTVAPTLPYPHQFPSVTVKAGDVTYLSIGTLGKSGNMMPTERDTADTFILSVVDPQLGAYEIYHLRQIHG